MTTQIQTAQIHISSVGTYHPNPSESIAWTINDTSGYLDSGPTCDECGACECDPHLIPDDGYADGGAPYEDDEIVCVGLSFSYICLDGGVTLCSDCAKLEGIIIQECDCT